MLLFGYFLLYSMVIFGNAVQALDGTKKTKCLNPPRTARRVELYIKECQEEVRTKMVSEAFQILKDQMSNEGVTSKKHDDDDDEEDIDYIEVSDSERAKSKHYITVDYQSDGRPYYFSQTTPKDSSTKRMARLLHRIRRVGDLSSGIYHPTLVPLEDKRIAGCLLHCVYAKNNAIDKLGWPTLDGLVVFYSEGVNEHGFFMATLRAVNLCLRAATQKYNINRRKQPEKGESCDLAFEVFDCISDQITGYCMDHFKH